MTLCPMARYDDSDDDHDDDDSDDDCADGGLVFFS